MLLIKNGKILTMAGKNYDTGSILIKDEKIVEVLVKIQSLITII